MRIFPKLENWAKGEECGRRLILEQLEARIVLDGAVSDAQDVHDHTADAGQVDSLGWVYVDNGWWQEDNGSGWWWEEATGWFWNELTGWWVLNSGDFSYWYHGEHQYWAHEISTDAWFWWDDITDRIWEPAFTWFADQVDSQWMWVYNDWNGSHFYIDELDYFYQDHSSNAWSWFDAVNDAVWKPAFTWYVDGSGVQVFNDWHSSEYIWGDDFHYIQQHTSSYVNDAPVINVPGTQTVDEDANLTIPAIYVFDVDSGNNLFEVSLSVQHGTLTLSATTNLAFISGDGTADTLMVFQGTWSQLNTALHDIVYRPDGNFDSSDALAIVVNDLGNSGSGRPQSVSESIPITVNAVNDEPWSDQIPSPSAVDEDFGIVEYNVSSYFHDIDSVLSYNLESVTYYGGLTLGNVVVDPSTVNVTFTSAPNSNGWAEIQITGSDGQYSTSKTFTFTVNPVNDAPIAVDNSVTTQEDSSHIFIAAEFGFSDLDTGDQLQAVQITALPAAGHLLLNGSDVILNQIITIADINAGHLTFMPDTGANGSDYAHFQFKVSDGTAFSTAAYLMTINVSSVNNIPTGADNTIGMQEDTSHAFIAGEFGFSDIDTGDQLQAVRITSLPTAGNLKLNGTDVILDQIITIADINAGHLTFNPAPDANGAGYASFQFKVSDGTAFSSSAYAMTLTVTPVNDAPIGTDNTLTMLEDTSHAFTAAEFGFSDVDTGDQLQVVRITSLPTAGNLKLNGTDVILDQIITIADINAGHLTFSPAADANGTGYTSFQFKVSDGTAFSNSAYAMTLNVTPVNDAPIGTNNTVTTQEDTFHAFIAAEFGFSDVDAGDQLQAVQITSLPTAGHLLLNGVDVILNQIITIADINAGHLTFMPDTGANSSDYAHFQFKVSDGTAFSTAAYLMTINVSSVNNVPSGADNTIGMQEDTSHAFIAGEFGFSDVDAGDQLQAVQITSLSTAGHLLLNGVDVILNQIITIADINSGHLTFSPAPDANGTGYSSFRFKVSDGIAFSNSAYAMTLNVTPVNDAPIGTDNTLTMMEDTSHAFTATEFGFSDVDAGDQLQAVQITSLSTAGNLKLNGTNVILNQIITIADINAGHLTFNPAPDANGTGYASFQFKVSDGSAFSNSAYAMTLNVTPVNDAPIGTNNTVTTQEDTFHAFIAAEFGFSDVDAGDQLQAVQITSLSTAGNLKLNGTNVILNQIITIADINAGHLTFNPAPDANGTGYASFQFKVSDGSAFSNSAYAMTLNVTPVNDAPIGTDNTLTMLEDTSHAFTAAEFGFSDVDAGDRLQAVQITSLSTAGHLLLNGVDVILNQIITIADINAGHLTFNSAPDANGTGYASFQFKVSDGSAFSNSAYAMTLDVTAVNDAPIGADNTITMLEDTSHAFTAAEFGFTDVDSGDQLQAVQITSLSTAGNLKLNGTNIILNQIITIADINAGHLTFSPAPDANGTGYAHFSFKVSDGSAFSTAAYVITIDVTSSNHAPTGADNSVSMLEDTSHTLVATEFGFSDVDTGDQLQAVQITSLPTAGSLKLNGTNVILNQIITIADINAGHLTFSPAANANGTGYASFQFKVSDGTAFSNSAYAMTLDVTPVNDTPTSTFQTTTLTENAVTQVSLIADDGDPEVTQTLTYFLETVPANGALYLTQLDAQNGTNPLAAGASFTGGTLWYRSTLNNDADTSFMFHVRDDAGTANGANDTSASALVAVTVTPDNQAPDAGDFRASVNEDGVVTISGWNFTDAEGNQAQSIRITDLPDHGTLFIDANDNNVVDPGEAIEIQPWNGGVTFTFDDGYLNNYQNAFPVLEEYDVEGVSLVVTGNVELGLPDTMTWAQLLEMQAAGWEIGSHSMTHADLTGLSDSQLIYELSESRNLLIEHGLTGTTFAYPYGAFNERVAEFVAQYYEGCREAWGNDGITEIPSNPYEIYNRQVTHTTTPEEVIQWIDDAVANNQWLVLSFHGIVTGEALDYEYNVNDLETIVSYVSSHNIATPTVSEALNNELSPISWADATTKLKYVGDQDYNGYDFFQYVVIDSADSEGEMPADAGTAIITVNAVNDAPLNSLPVAQTTGVNAALTFSTGNNNAISLSDADAGTESVGVQLTVTEGNLTLGGTTGLSFVTGDGTADSTMTFSGKIADINAAFQGMSYTPTTDYSGDVIFQIVTNDLGNNPSGEQLDTDELTITVRR